MNPKIASIAARIKSLEDELEAEIAERRDELRFTVHERKVRFESEVRRKHRELKTRLSFPTEQVAQHVPDNANGTDE